MTDNTKMPQTLLLADDSVTIQRVIELTFADEAITVVAVSDGDQAIGRIESDPPDIVLVDIGMPGRSGYEVARHVKESPRLKHIPVLLLAGAFEPVDQAKAVAAGCDGVLAKPFEPQLVIARVKELLGHGRNGGAMATQGHEGLGPSLGAGPGRPADAFAAPTSTGPFGESWGTPQGETTGEKPRPAQVVHLDNYFEQLDAAFQMRSGSAPAGLPKDSAGAAADIIDWFAATPAASDPLRDLRLSPAAPQQSEPDPTAASAVHVDSVSSPPELPPAPHEPPAPRQSPPLPEPISSSGTQPRSTALPSLADAFAAILAAEQHEPTPALAPEWPASLVSSNGAASLGEEAIEEIVRRVLDRLSDQVVRSAVADAISGIAERLVSEEIDRIKSSIK